MRGVSQQDLSAAHAILDAYNRSNGLNLMALTALVVDPAGPPANDPVPPAPRPWPPLRPLLHQDDMSQETWRLLHDIALIPVRFGPSTREPSIATIWRHLAHWPGLLALAYTGLCSLGQSGQLERAMAHVDGMAQTQGARLAHLRTGVDAIPKDAYNLIAQYASGVHRIVTLGHILSNWLHALDAEGA